MIGGFSRPKKDKAVKVCEGQQVKAGQILIRGLPHYKAGLNTDGKGTIFALCQGRVHFSRRKTPRGKIRTFVNVIPLEVNHR